MKHEKSIVRTFGLQLGLPLLLLCGWAGTLQAARPAPAPFSRSMQERKARYLFLEAQRQKLNGAVDSAFDLLLQASAVDSSDAAIRFELGAFYLMLGDPLQARSHLQQAVALDADNYYYNMMLANLLQKLGEVDSAAVLYDRMIVRYPDKPELHYMQADLYAEAGRLQQAVSALDSMESSTGVLEPLSLQKYRLYKELGQPERGYDEIRRLIESNPGEVRYRVLLGNLYLEADDPDRAWQAFGEAERVDPNNGYLFLSKANYFDKTGKKEQAVSQIEKALYNEELDVETKLEILSDYGSALFARKADTAPLYRLFDQLLYFHPQEPQLHTRYGEFLLAERRDSLAAEQFQIVTDLEPTDLKAWLSLMGIALSRENYARAAVLGEKALQYLPDAVQLYLYTGIAQSQAGRREASLSTFQTGLSRIDPTNRAALSDFYGQMGDVLHQSGKKQDAYDAYDKALEYNPDNIGVLNNYSYFLSLDKRELGKAERMSGRTVEREPNNSTYLDTYAWVYFQQGNYRLAKFYLESALSKGGEKNPEILEHYGDALYRLGLSEEALENWKKAQEAGGRSPLLQRKIETKQYYEP